MPTPDIRLRNGNFILQSKMQNQNLELPETSASLKRVIGAFQDSFSLGQNKNEILL
jgi:hypothetical protein